jgi:hypothetical protein
MNILVLGQSNAARWFRNQALGSKGFNNAFANYGQPVNLVNAAVGGTSLLPGSKRGYWLDNNPGSLYANAIEAAKSAGKIDAAIWIQGEHESKNGANPADYESGLGSFFERLRGDLGDIPVYMQPLVLPQHLTSGIREAQLSYASSNPFVNLIHPNMSKIESLDGNHFTQPSYRRIAKKFANHMLKDFGLPNLLSGGLPLSASRDI